MIKYVIFLLFLYGINYGDSSSDAQDTADSSDVLQSGIKKNEVGANGLENNSREILKNFRNPVLEYLLSKNLDRTAGPPKKGIIREIRHSQTLLIPNTPEGGIHLLPVSILNQLPAFQEQKQPTQPSQNLPPDNFWNYLKNKTKETSGNTQESVVTSQVLHLNKSSPENREESTKIQIYPAVAVVLHTYNKDGTLKNSVTHFQPDFNSMKTDTNNKEAFNTGNPINEKEYKNIQNAQQTVKNVFENNPNAALIRLRARQQQPRQAGIWPFADYFPIVINDPFMAVYSAFASSMYNAVSSVVEYGPEADICGKEAGTQKNSGVRSEQKRYGNLRQKFVIDRYEKKEEHDPNFFDEVTMRSETFRRINPTSLKRPERKRRDTTSIFLKTKQGEKVDITLEEPADEKDFSETNDERARSFSSVLVNPPPLSTILRPPHTESRQFLGYADKRKKTKPSKPVKEEGSSEEVGEEHEEENSSQGQESANEAVAISPPPEGASVAEAKPIGLAIAGPGGVAASKPQGTAVAGPGGLAIARPVGTAIAGVEVEGSVPIGGQQKNKKKPKQEQEQTDSELHYVGGLTGPIGNPQPKEFADTLYYKTAKGSQRNNIQDNLFFRGRTDTAGYQVKLGQQNGKYGFVPMFASPVQGSERLQKRMDTPTFFHGLLGNNAQENDQPLNYQLQY